MKRADQPDSGRRPAIFSDRALKTAICSQTGIHKSQVRRAFLWPPAYPLRMHRRESCAQGTNQHLLAYTTLRNSSKQQIVWFMVASIPKAQGTE
jgi:hypothetical protein